MVTPYAHKLARLLERRSQEAEGLHDVRLDGMTWEQHAAAHGLERIPYQSAAQTARARMQTRALFGRLRDDQA